MEIAHSITDAYIRTMPVSTTIMVKLLYTTAQYKSKSIAQSIVSKFYYLLVITYIPNYDMAPSETSETLPTASHTDHLLTCIQTLLQALLCIINTIFLLLLLLISIL